MSNKLLVLLALVFAFSLTISTDAVAQENDPEPDDRQEQMEQRRERMNRERPGRRGQGRRRGGRGGRGGAADTNKLLAAEVAPDFTLKSLDGKSESTLAELRSEKPVVLFFGSYT